MNGIDSESAVLNACQAVIGYQFGDLLLLRSALTHTSGANTRLASNERLEFLGDAVLGLVCVERLYRRFPEYQEGEMTKVKSAVVSRQTCARLSRRLRLGEFLFIGRGMRAGELPANLLADVFESVVGAMYLDGGMEAVQPFLTRVLEPEIDLIVQDVAVSNYKSHLQQIVQRDLGATPRYVVLDEQGPDHHRSFKVAVIVGDQRYPAAWGPNKKLAESRAAENALAVIENRDVPHDFDAG